MARSPHQAAAAPALLPLSIMLLLVIVFLPAKWTATPARRLADQITILFAPISGPSARLAQIFTIAGPDPVIDAEDAVRVIDELHTRNRQLELRVQQLNQQLDDLSRGQFLLPDAPVRTILRPVISPGGRLIRVRGGQNEGINRATIAVAGRSQLIGRVQDVESRTALVQPITAVETGRFNARILETPDSASGRACQLYPLGDGTLEGESDSEQQTAGAFPIRVGQTVVLDDPAWPSHAQMLVVGTVQSVQDHPQTSLRKVITVAPTTQVRRVAQVYLRTPINNDADSATNQTGGTP